GNSRVVMHIAHISDIHVARPPVANDVTAKRFLAYINYRLFRGRRYQENVAAAAVRALADRPPDLVLLTGDITQHGLDAEFEAALALLQPLIDRKIPILAVPGNHDIYGCTEPGRLREFQSRVAAGLKPGEGGIYRFPGVEILPLAQGIPTPLFFSHGRQDERELAEAARVWQDPPDGVMRLVCGHYPVIDTHGGHFLYFRGLRGADRLIEFCRDRSVSGYFCGHTHKRFSAEMPGGCREYVAPALSAVRESAQEWVSVYACGPGLGHPRDVREMGN
ncbi:MAG: metallophosphoesterase, partial [Planctomycetes bacterium]|nr:metallophosphoesterase [Planctomycetota bacterium]